MTKLFLLVTHVVANRNGRNCSMVVPIPVGRNLVTEHIIKKSMFEFTSLQKCKINMSISSHPSFHCHRLPIQGHGIILLCEGLQSVRRAKIGHQPRDLILH